jgi:hypothetical protein
MIVIRALITSANVKSRYGHHPRHKVPDDVGLMLAGGAFQRIRALERTRARNLHSHRSEACEPMIETRQSPGRSASACSTMAAISERTAGTEPV